MVQASKLLSQTESMVPGPLLTTDIKLRCSSKRFTAAQSVCQKALITLQTTQSGISKSIRKHPSIKDGRIADKVELGW